MRTRVRLSREEGLALLERVQWHVSVAGVAVVVHDVVHDADARDAPIARIQVDAVVPVSPDALELELEVRISEDGVQWATWTATLSHEDMEEQPYDADGEEASQAMVTDDPFVARAFYTRSLPRKWLGIRVSVSSLALWSFMAEF
jgi:hypothetical protein